MSDWWIDESIPAEPLTSSESIRIPQTSVVTTEIARMWGGDGEILATKVAVRMNLEQYITNFKIYENCDVIVGDQLIGRLSAIGTRSVPENGSTPFNRTFTSYHEVTAVFEQEHLERT